MERRDLDTIDEEDINGIQHVYYLEKEFYEKEQVEDFINEIESEINECKGLLDDLEDISRINECLDILEKLSKRLF